MMNIDHERCMIRSLLTSVKFNHSAISGKRKRATLQAAGEAAIAAEIANAAMYDRLLSTTQHPDIITVLRNLIKHRRNATCQLSSDA